MNRIRNVKAASIAVVVDINEKKISFAFTGLQK